MTDSRFGAPLCGCENRGNSVVDATAHESNEMYDGQTAEPSPINAIDDRDDNNPAKGGISFRLEIIAISGREGEKLQAIQARAIRDALLWAIEQQARDDSPGEGK